MRRGGTAVRTRRFVYLLPQAQKSSLHFQISKVRAAFVPCGVFRRPKILFRLLNINQAFQHAVQSAVYRNLVDFLGNFFQCLQFFHARLFMKTLRSLTCIAVISALCACGQKPDEPAAQQQQASPAQASATKTPQPLPQPEPVAPSAPAPAPTPAPASAPATA